MEQSISKGCSNPSVHNSPPTKFEDLNNGYKESHPAAIEEKKNGTIEFSRVVQRYEVQANSLKFWESA